MRCAVFASGSGSNFQALIDRQKSADLHVDFAVLIANNSRAFACQRARSNGIPVEHLPPTHFAHERSYAAKLAELLGRYRVEMIALAGYMKKIPPQIVGEYRHRMLNIHPGLLPAFGGRGLYGKHVHRAVLDYGAKISGVTIHFVDEEYDHGPVVIQKVVDVLDDDTPQSLAERVLELEHAYYWRAVEAVAQQRITVKGRRVIGQI
ncbi:MAG: phosphoribosylglycinamide formyltransferase [Chitinivibrionales bacterium]|nr:phosphoribosylglycinamide formyltransferase [Chitinivibrionales bacterium]